jgi:hypothetical protein
MAPHSNRKLNVSFCALAHLSRTVYGRFLLFTAHTKPTGKGGSGST